MIVTQTSFRKTLAHLQLTNKFALDTETTGLKPYQGDKLFSIIITRKEEDGHLESYYFNTWQYPGLSEDCVLPRVLLREFEPLFAREDAKWYLHNAKYDMAILLQDGLTLDGTVHCTRSGARLERSDLLKYDLDSCAERIHLHKDSAVEDYVEKHHLWDWEIIRGKKSHTKKKYFYKVPWDIIVPYGCQDGVVTYKLGEHQEEVVKKFSDWVARKNPHTPVLQTVLENERQLTKTVFDIERVGVKIDRGYCEKALSYESDRTVKLCEEYKKLTGLDFKNSPVDFAKVFVGEKDKWLYTEKGAPSFKGDTLEFFDHPAAQVVLDIRDGFSKQNFYSNFLYFADRDDVVHPNFNPDGARTGRFSSSNPNFQNLTAEDVLFCRACKAGSETIIAACKDCGSTDLEMPEFLTRRAVVPRPGYVFFMPDYDQMEYRMLFDTACQLVGRESPLVTEILKGKDPHQATADLVTSLGRVVLVRKKAKNGNFALVYGAGNAKLAKTIKGTIEDARAVRVSILSAAPEVKQLIEHITAAAHRQGYIRNWYGRRIYIPEGKEYKATNAFVQGGCADGNKLALNRIALDLRGCKSRIALTIHDENPIEVHETEIATIPQRVKQIMEGVYPYRFLPLTCGAEWSDKSLGDKRKGYPA